MNNFREIGESFCKYYYENIRNPDSIANLYTNTALITHNGEEMVGYDKYRLKLKFCITPQTIHTPIKILSQPISSPSGESIVISTVVNRINSFIKTTYIEMFVLNKFNGNLFITNNIIMDI